MDIYWETVKHMIPERSALRSFYSRPPLLLLGFLYFFAGCTGKSENPNKHFFLKGYDHLEFQDTKGNKVYPQSYIYNSQMNSVKVYLLRDTSLILYNNRYEEPYTGFIRTYDRNRNNLQGEFKKGKMVRLRYWYPDRKLGMDADYRNGSGVVWNQNGVMAINWNAEEMYYINIQTQKVKQIITDTITSYFDKAGMLTNYTIRRDCTITHYYGNGQPRFQFPNFQGHIRSGVAKRWYPNGQLKVIGNYENGKQKGVWIEYDSLGNEIKKEYWE